MAVTKSLCTGKTDYLRKILDDNEEMICTNARYGYISQFNMEDKLSNDIPLISIRQAALAPCYKIWKYYIGEISKTLVASENDSLKKIICQNLKNISKKVLKNTDNANSLKGLLISIACFSEITGDEPNLVGSKDNAGETNLFSSLKDEMTQFLFFQSWKSRKILCFSAYFSSKNFFLYFLNVFR